MIDRIRGPRLVVAEEELARVEVHSEELGELLGAIPHWTVRSGQGYLLLAALVALLLSWFIHYPETVDAPVVLRATHPPASLVARSAGFLSLRAADGDRVSEGALLGYLANAASVDTVLRLRSDLAAYASRFHGGQAVTFDLRRYEGAPLGELQEAYGAFAAAVRDEARTSEQQVFARQRAGLDRQLAAYRVLLRQAETTRGIVAEDLALASSRFGIDSSLFARGLAAQTDYQERRRAYLAAQRDDGAAASSVTSATLAIAQLEDRIRESADSEREQQGRDHERIDGALRKLDAGIGSWELAYLFRAPMSGRISLFSYWSDHQYVRPGDEVLAVVSDSGALLAQVDAPVDRAGELRVGQEVRLRFAGYPPEQYGIVRGVVQRISLVPREKLYRLAVRLPDGLATSFGRTLPTRQELVGTAVIVTEDLRLAARVLHRTRALFAP